MSKVIIRAPHVDTVVIDNVMSSSTNELNITFFSDYNGCGECRGHAPLTSVVEWVK